MKTPWWFLRKTPLAFILLPASWLYFVISKLVYSFRKIRQKTSVRPIICIGNIFAGGVGKTPIVQEIARYFDAPIVMRGYKKSSKTDGVGDEAKMLAKAGFCVHVGDRKSNIALLNRQKAKTPIVMDDGFQNPTIKKDITILVFDEGLGFGNGFLLPAGPLREPKSAIKLADAVIIIRGAKSNSQFSIPQYGVPVFYATSKTINPYAGERIVAFAGIGYPKKFFNALPAVKTKSFPDHHQYTTEDIQKLMILADKKNAKLVTTEKDWVRLPKNIQKEIKFAPLQMVVEPAFWKWLKEKTNENV